MRLLIVGAITGGTVPIGRAIYSAFKELIPYVEFLDYSYFLPEFEAVKSSGNREHLHRFLLQCQIRLMESVAAFSPDVILGISQSPLTDRQVLTKLRQSGIKLCYWFVEDYRIFDYWKDFAQFYDYFFTIQKDPFWDQLKTIGCDNFYYLPTAFDNHLKHSCDQKGQDINISFMGAPYLNRIYYFSRINRSDFQIYGQDWDVTGLPSIVIGDRLITEVEARQIYHRSRININLHSSMAAISFGQGDFVNPRTFELAGLGAFQLADITKLLPLHFNIRDEIVACMDWLEMEKAIDYFLVHDDEREEISRKSMGRVLRDHTYDNRAREIISLIG